MKRYITTILPDAPVKEKMYRVTMGSKTHLIKAKNYENAILRFEILKDERKLR